MARGKYDVILGEMREFDDATPMDSEVRQQTVLAAGQLVLDTTTGVLYYGDGETMGGKPLAAQSTETAFVYGVDVDKYTTTAGVDQQVSSTSRTQIVLNHAYDYDGAPTSLRYHAVESFAQTPAHAFHAVLRDLERGRDVCSLDISDYTKKADGSPLTEQQKRGFWIEGGEKRLVDFCTRVPQYYYRIDHYDVTVSDVVHHHTVKLLSHEPFIGSVKHPGFFDSGSILTLDNGRQYARTVFKDNGTTAYAWWHGDSDIVYTKSATPVEGDKVYSNSAATTETGRTVATFEPGGSTASDIYVMLYEGVLCDANGIPKEQTNDATQVSRSVTDRLRSIMGYRPSTYVTRANFRVNANNNHCHLKSMLMHQALELLMEIDLGNINAQPTLSDGLANCASWNYAETRKTGRSARFGNSTVTYNGDTPIKPEILADEDVSTITVNGTVYTRDLASDSGSAKGWKNGSAVVYTKFEVPTVYVPATGSGDLAIPAFGDKAFSNTALTNEAGEIADVTGLDYDFLHMATGGTSIWRAGKAHVVSFSWRGIENLYGEVFEFVDGCQKYQENNLDTITTTDDVVWTRSWADNYPSTGTVTAFAWKNGNTLVYTNVFYPSTSGANANVYTDSAKTLLYSGGTVKKVTEDYTASGMWYTNDTDLYLKLDASLGAGAYGEKFPSRGYTGDSIAWVWHPWPKHEGYILNYDDFSYLCITTGGGESTYFGDYLYSNANPGAFVASVGGNANGAGSDGPGFVAVSGGLGSSSAYFGGRATARADEGTDHLAEGTQSA